jgi:hypothetical protein
MLYSLRKPYKKYTSVVTELNKIVLSLCNQTESVTRDTHLEGCFIRFVVSWECFVEEYFLKCLCGARTRSGKNIMPNNKPCRDLNNAFKKINKNRRSRDKDFIDWLEYERVRQNISDNFRKNSRVWLLCEAPDKVHQVRVIRNAIAHRSESSIVKFEKFVKDQMGYIASLNPTMASLLIQKDRQTNDLIFTILTSYFLLLANRLTK